MTSQLTVQAVERYDDHYHVRFHDADDFGELETPDCGDTSPSSRVGRLGQ